MAEVGVTQGLPALGFEVLDYRNRVADGLNVCATEGAVRGEFVYYSAAGVVSRAGTGLGANANYAGFLDVKRVVAAADWDNYRIDQAAEYVVVGRDKVAVWREGKFRVIAVDGVVADGATVYPAANGKISATRTGTDRAIGRAIAGNAGVSGGPVVVELLLFGVPFVAAA